MEPFLVVVGLVALFAAYSNLRVGVALTMVSGFASDILRKLSTGHSPFWVGLVLTVFGATLLGAWQRRSFRWWRRPAWRGVVLPFQVAAFALLLLAAYTSVRGHPPVLIGVGLASYLGPVSALLLGYWAGQDAARVRAGLWFYLALVLVMASGLVFARQGRDWTLLKSVGVGLVVYDLEAGAVVLPSGFFRTPEVASWHCATAVCVALILAITRKGNVYLASLLAGASAFLIWAVLQAGRRKGVGEIVVFFVLFGLLMVLVRGKAGRLGQLALVAALVGAIAFQGSGIAQDSAAQIGSMRSRSEVGGGTLGRVVGSITSLPLVVNYNGFLGRGVGTLAQGGQYFGAEENAAVVSEGGIGRIVGELGAPGAGLVLFTAFQFLLAMRQRLPRLRYVRPAVANQTLGLLALLGANTVVFVSAHQIFGDPYVYVLLGLVAGIVTATADQADAAGRRSRSARTQVSGSVLLPAPEPAGRSAG